jgi:hypothetical protein
MQLMCNADVLILPLNKSHEENARGLIPGKVFEYIATGNKVLITGDQDSDVGNLVRTYEKGFVVRDGDIRTLCGYLHDFIERAPIQKETNKTMSPAMFERRHLTGELVSILEKM